MVTTRIAALEPNEHVLDLSALPGIAAAYDCGPQTLIVETNQGREVRITARRDIGSGNYISEYESRATVRSGSNVYHVWTRTPAHRPCVASDPASCLAESARTVADAHVY